MADVVIDSDTFNEINDPFAIAYALRSTERMTVRALYAAPFHNELSTGPADGMEKSFTQITRLLHLASRLDLAPYVYRGSTQYLAGEDEPVHSDAADDLIERSRAYRAEEPLYVIALGAITNIASALLIDPTLAERIVVIWMGGHAHHWPDTHEFNMAQDIAAARVVFNSGVPLVQLPGMGVTSGFTLSSVELDQWLRGANPLCDYLVDATFQAAERYVTSPIWSRVIWDICAVAWLVSGDLVLDRLEPTPLPEYDGTYRFRPEAPPYRYVYHIQRDALQRDMVKKLIC